MYQMFILKSVFNQCDYGAYHDYVVHKVGVVYDKGLVVKLAILVMVFELGK